MLVGDGPERAQLEELARRLGGRRANRVPRRPLARRRAADGRRRRGGAALERLGEPAPCRGRGPLRRSARGLDAGRRRTRGRPRRRERAARPARSPGRARGGDPSPARRARSARDGWLPAAKPSVEAISSEAVYGRIEALLAAAALSERAPTRPLRRARCVIRCRCPAGSRRSGTRSTSMLDYRFLAGGRAGRRPPRRALPALRARPAEAAGRDPLLPPAAVTGAPPGRRVRARRDLRRPTRSSAPPRSADACSPARRRP